MTVTGRDFVSGKVGKTFGAKGPGAELELATDLLPVLLTHDLEKGFYPPFVPWVCSFDVGPTAAQYSFASLGLQAAAGDQARAIIDVVAVLTVSPWIQVSFRSGNIGLGTVQIVPAQDIGNAQDFDELAGPTYFDTRVGTMEAQYGTSATDFANGNGRLFPGGNNLTWNQTATHIILRQGQVVLFRSNNVNENIRVFCKGRFYEQ